MAVADFFRWGFRLLFLLVRGGWQCFYRPAPSFSIGVGSSVLFTSFPFSNFCHFPFKQPVFYYSKIGFMGVFFSRSAQCIGFCLSVWFFCDSAQPFSNSFYVVAFFAFDIGFALVFKKNSFFASARFLCF